MKPFRKSRDFDGRFALRTLQNPNLDVSSRFEEMYAAKKRAEAKVAADEALLATNSSEPSPSATRDEVPASPAVSESAPDRPNILENQASPTVLASESEIELARHAESNPEPQPETANSVLALTAAPPLVPEPAKRRARKAKPHNNARASRAIALSRRRTARSLPKPELSPLERHSRKCIICKHRDREAIEEDFLNWSHPDYIAENYELNDYRAIYRHAHAIGLMERRSMNLRFAAESVIEQSASVMPSADAVLRAIRMCTRINNRGEWHDPPSHVIVSSGSRINVDNRSIILQASPESPAPESAAIPAQSSISNRQ
jgi:hypothetical protein